MKKENKTKLSLTLWCTAILFLENLVAVGFATVVVTIINSITKNAISLSSELMVFLFSLAIGTALAFLLNKFFIVPLRRVYDSMGRVAKGDFGVRIEEKTRINEIDNIYKNFNLMAEELGAMEIIQADFISNVSHEFKTPINAIEGYSMLLQGEKNISEEQKMYIEKILFNTNRLSTLIGNILLLAKLDNQIIQTKRSKFRLDEQVRQAVMMHEIKWTEKNINLDVELDEVEYLGTEDLLLHVWSNLLSNAIKFSPVDGQIKMSLKDDANTITFIISDEGEGVPDKIKNKIFDKFYQADSVHKREGNGLGLALVRQIVNINGGKITVLDNIERGAVFKVVLNKY